MIGYAAVMARLTALVALLLTVSCSRPPAPEPAQAADASAGPKVSPSAAAPAAAPMSSEPCTLATPLVPGIPGSPGHLIRSDINPNGQSELSAHMRTMQAQLKLARQAIEHGEKPAALAAAFAKIRCAWPTTLSDRNAEFDASAQAYLAAVAALDAATAASAAPAYGRVLDACRSCHERTCSGAIVAIEALRLPEKAQQPPGPGPHPLPKK